MKNNKNENKNNQNIYDDEDEIKYKKLFINIDHQIMFEKEKDEFFILLLKTMISMFELYKIL